MKTELMTTQIEDIEKIAASSDLPNFSEPGTGKTLTTIGAIERTYAQSGVVICPTIATSMWAELLSYELGVRVQRLLTRGINLDKAADFYVLSYGVLAAHYPQLMQSNFDVLIVDESHYCKSIEAERTRLIFGVTGNGEGGLCELSQNCWILTGTPIERYADDLWSQIRATHPDVLAKYRALTLPEFQRQFCRMMTKNYNGHERYVSVDTQNERLLNRMLYEDIGAIRRTMAEVDPYLPETTFRDIYVRSKANAELRDMLRGKTVAQIEELLLGGGDMITRARRLLGVSKVDGLFDYVIEQSKRGQLVLGYWHTEVGSIINERLTGAGVKSAVLGGATSPARRDLIKKMFIAGDLQVIVGQIQAMGVAMDGLQYAGNHVIFIERDWSATKMEQFYKRVARKGQRHHTQVDFLMSDNPIDIALKNVAQHKKLKAGKVLTS